MDAEQYIQIPYNTSEPSTINRVEHQSIRPGKFMVFNPISSVPHFCSVIQRQKCRHPTLFHFLSYSIMQCLEISLQKSRRFYSNYCSLQELGCLACTSNYSLLLTGSTIALLLEFQFIEGSACLLQKTSFVDTIDVIWVYLHSQNLFLKCLNICRKIHLTD